MYELKACPFCGGDASLMHEEKGINNDGSVVRCKACGIKGQWIAKSYRYASDALAIEAWNRRSDNG